MTGRAPGTTANTVRPDRRSRWFRGEQARTAANTTRAPALAGKGRQVPRPARPASGSPSAGSSVRRTCGGRPTRAASRACPAAALT
ncbi:hypothetical protein SNL152K_1656 [Streptomyces sp. NL15-2K]|nr:hypothetical protein SNL152K_1656 [Streptomyces sp. NL15-2K]